MFRLKFIRQVGTFKVIYIPFRRRTILERWPSPVSDRLPSVCPWHLCWTRSPTGRRPTGTPGLCCGRTRTIRQPTGRQRQLTSLPAE